MNKTTFELYFLAMCSTTRRTNGGSGGEGASSNLPSRVLGVAITSNHTFNP